MMTNNQSTPPNMHSRGGIDQQIQDGMNRSGNDPAKAKEVYGKSGDVKDLLVWQKLANTFKEIDKATSLAKNGSPPTLMDSLPQEVMGRMTGKQNLQEKASGVAGVLQNQQRQQQQQQGQPQGQPKLASGGIINAPAPNLNRMYNGGIVGYAKGGEISREEYIEKVKALIASGVEQKDAMAQMDKEFDILSGTREERRDVTLEDNRLLPRGNRRSIRADEVYGTEAPSPGFSMGKSTQGNQPYSVSDPEGDLLAAIAGEKQPEDIVAPGPATVTSAVKEPVIKPEIKPEGIAGVFDKDAFDPTAYGAPRNKKEEGEELPTISGDDFAKQLAGITTVDPETGKPTTREAFNQKVGADKEQAQEDAFQAALPPEESRLAKGLGMLARTPHTPSYGSNFEAAASYGRDLVSTRNARDRRAEGVEAKAVEAKAKESEYARTLGQQISVQNQAADESAKTREASRKQLEAELTQNGAYQDAMIAVREQANEISKITGGNQNALLSAKNKQQVFAILTTMSTNHREMTRLEVESIMNRLGDVATNRVDAKAHEKTRNAEFAALQKSLVGTLNSDEGAGKGLSYGGVE